MAFYSLAKTNELTEGFKRSVKLPELTVFIFFHDGELYIIEDQCPHMDVPLSTGTIEASPASSGQAQGALIRCRAHGIGFDLATGKADGMWTNTLPCLTRFEPVYRDYSVGIDIKDAADDGVE
ncbi:MAG TPA: Rieske 2Fe-2S domain-containing protein [Marinagarivorans sp.]